MENFDAIWNYPTQIHMGIGKTKTLPALCAELNILNPLFVTDSVLAESSMFQLAVSHCLKQGLGCETFSHVASNPTDKNVMAGVDAFLAGRHDGIIAFGGGSSIDAGKAIAFMVDQSRPLWGFEDGGGNWRRANTENIAPVIALPTTAGTGSEVGRVSVITDSKLRVKRFLFLSTILQNKVILIPE